MAKFTNYKKRYLNIQFKKKEAYISKLGRRLSKSQNSAKRQLRDSQGRKVKETGSFFQQIQGRPGRLEVRQLKGMRMEVERGETVSPKIRKQAGDGADRGGRVRRGAFLKGTRRKSIGNSIQERDECGRALRGNPDSFYRPETVELLVNIGRASGKN